MQLQCQTPRPFIGYNVVLGSTTGLSNSCAPERCSLKEKKQAAELWTSFSDSINVRAQRASSALAALLSHPQSSPLPPLPAHSPGPHVSPLGCPHLPCSWLGWWDSLWLLGPATPGSPHCSWPPRSPWPPRCPDTEEPLLDPGS